MAVIVVAVIYMFVGITILWTRNIDDLPFLKELWVVVFLDLIGISFAWWRGYLRTSEEELPKTYRFKDEDAFAKYFIKFTSRTSQVDAVTGTCRWVNRDVINAVRQRTQSGTSYNFIVREITPNVRKLERSGAKITKLTSITPYPAIRFTLINRDIANGEVLAISEGAGERMVTFEFDRKSSKMIIPTIKEFLRAVEY